MQKKLNDSKMRLIETNFKTLVDANHLYSLIEQISMRGFLKDQILRASSSIALNLADKVCACT